MKQPAQHVFEKQRQRPNHMLNWIPSISLMEGKVVAMLLSGMKMKCVCADLSPEC